MTYLERVMSNIEGIPKSMIELMWTHSSDVIFIIDLYGNIMKINPAFTKVLGWTEEDIILIQHKKILPQTKNTELSVIMQSIVKREAIPFHEVQRLKKDGSVIEVLAAYHPLIDSTDEVVGAIVMYKDRNEKNQKLKENQEKYQIVTEHSTDLITVLDTNGRIMYVSPSVESTTGFTFKELEGNLSFEHVHPEDRQEVQDIFFQIVQDGIPRVTDFRLLTKEGCSIWVEGKSFPTYNDDQQLSRLVCILRDITERKKYEEELKLMAYHDTITGLPNKRYLMDTLQLLIEGRENSSSLLVVVCLDIYRFKHINDSFGIFSGDVLLKLLAERLVENSKPQEFVARLNGDEFVFVLEEESQEKISERITSIHRLFDEPFKMNEHELRLASSWKL
uniref:PAS domain S-box protein n=1 Tax=Caldalkalibacillus mannanilyticus TaxID=1418 RepID=UPI000468DCD3